MQLSGSHCHRVGAGFKRVFDSAIFFWNARTNAQDTEFGIAVDPLLRPDAPLIACRRAAQPRNESSDALRAVPVGTEGAPYPVDAGSSSHWRE
jgi:hypothetical protein